VFRAAAQSPASSLPPFPPAAGTAPALAPLRGPWPLLLSEVAQLLLLLAACMISNKRRNV
jgi:hypothetical protein